MLHGQYRRIFHYHLKKCGGSTLNRWLDTLTFDDRAYNGVAWKGISIFDPSLGDSDDVRQTVIPSLAKTLFHWSDIIHSHAPLHIYAPEDTFCLTLLRDPVQRVLSQVSDWRRLSDADTVDHPEPLRACVADSRRLPLADFLEKQLQRGGYSLLDNYMTRALAAGRTGNLIDKALDADHLSDLAIHSLERDYHLVGLTDELDLTRNAFCSMIGFPPARGIPTINASRIGEHPNRELVDGLRDILDSLTRLDRLVYNRARELFDKRHRRAAEIYEAEEFEARHASRLLGEARGYCCQGATRYSVQMPIIGSGFHGRDGSRMPSCAVWSGPDTRTTIYIPTPANLQLSLLVWIRGYADSAQREQVRVRVNGTAANHHFEYADNYADLLTINTYSTRNFVRLEIEVDETRESGAPGTDLHDPRRRGFALDSYGWRPL